MENSEQEKGKTFRILEIIEYEPHSVVNKLIFKKITGDITVSSFDSKVTSVRKASPFDIFIQAIDGNAEIVINEESYQLAIGESIIIPAHSRITIKANVRFKMICTVLKSGYEEVTI